MLENPNKGWTEMGKRKTMKARVEVKPQHKH